MTERGHKYDISNIANKSFFYRYNIIIDRSCGYKYEIILSNLNLFFGSICLEITIHNFKVRKHKSIKNSSNIHTFEIC